MALIHLRLDPPTRELRQFATIWFPAFGGLLGLLIWHLAGMVTPAAIIWSVFGVWSLVGVLSPPAIRPAWIGLMLAAFPIGFVVSWVALGIIWFLVLTPTALIMRLFGRDALALRPDRSATTCWQPRETVSDRARYFRQF